MDLQTGRLLGIMENHFELYPYAGSALLDFNNLLEMWLGMAKIQFLEFSVVAYPIYT